MIRRMVEIQQGRMQMVSGFDKMKTFHQFEDSNYFWKEGLRMQFWKLMIFERFAFYTQRKLKQLLENRIETMSNLEFC